METGSPHSSQGPVPWTCLGYIRPASRGFLKRMTRVARAGKARFADRSGRLHPAADGRRTVRCGWVPPGRFLIFEAGLRAYRRTMGPALQQK
jgi:hypothetical protein